MTNSFPGGLRAQLILALGVLLIGGASLGAVVLESVLTRRLLASRQAHARSVVAAVEALDDPGRGALVSEGVVDAIVGPDLAHGPQELVDRLYNTSSDAFSVGDRHFMRVQSGDVTIAIRVDDLQADVSNARGVVLLFGGLSLLVVLALGYAFFGFIVVRPIRAIGVATERAAQGDLASQISLQPRNEIGGVARSFNEMLVRIDQNREELEGKVEELLRANLEIEATRDSLVRSEKLASVGHLAAGIAHEIGNPLAALSGYNELLLDADLEPAEAAELLERSGVQLERIRGVIRNLLDFSRDERAVEPSAVALASCVHETINLVRPTASKALKFEVGDIAGPAVWCVASQVVQVLVNLAMNAVDAVGEAGTIRVSRQDTERFAVLVFEDSGPGVPPELVDRIFDPFFTTKEPGAGTGLGLAISARIIESFGGALSVRDSDLGGAAFVLRLPYAEEA